MGQCLSRWCDENDEIEVEADAEPVHNGHMVAEYPIPPKNPSDFEVVTASPTLQPTSAVAPNTPRNVHVSMFVCQNGTHSACMENGDSGGDCLVSSTSDSCGDFFSAYCDPLEDSIVADGVERLCADLGFQPEDFSILVLAWRFNVSGMCRFTREEFIGGCRRLGVDSAPMLSDKLSVISSEAVADRNTFRNLYQWSYRFALDPTAGQRTLPVDVAIAMWRVVFSVPRGSSGVARAASWVVPMWLEFVEQHSGVRGITRDTWDMFFNFVESLDDSSGMSGYDETEAWPSLFDDFVKWSHTRPRSIPTAWPDIDADS